MQQPSPSAPSVPPPSYPPAPSQSAERLSLPNASGWRPADDDDSPEAVAWRARTSLRRADRALTALGTLNENVSKLNGTIEAWSTTWDKHWKTVSRIAWGVGIPVLITIVLGAGAYVWRWVSSLHH